jgi:hypothetical protein
MAKRNRSTTQKIIDKRTRAGRGQGHGAAYKPWLLVQDVASQGLAHRVKGWTTGRVHHLLSNLERDYFYVLDWSANVHDIREQYPLLPLEETLAIATRCGLRHPLDPITRQPIVMTTDFAIDVMRQGQQTEQARAVKPSTELNKKRVLEKLEIERLYWQKQGIDWGIVTEQEIPQVYADNVRKLHSYKQIDDRLPAEMSINEVICTLATLAQRDRPLKDIVKQCDAVLGAPSGTALTVAYHLLATRTWKADLSLPLASHTLLVQVAEEVVL